MSVEGHNDQKPRVLKKGELGSFGPCVCDLSIYKSEIVQRDQRGGECKSSLTTKGLLNLYQLKLPCELFFLCKQL